MKKHTSKLKLARETLRALASRELGEVAGGTDKPATRTRTPSCPKLCSVKECTLGTCTW